MSIHWCWVMDCGLSSPPAVNSASCALYPPWSVSHRSETPSLKGLLCQSRSSPVTHRELLFHVRTKGLKRSFVPSDARLWLSHRWEQQLSYGEVTLSSVFHPPLELSFSSLAPRLRRPTVYLLLSFLFSEVCPTFRPLLVSVSGCTCDLVMRSIFHTLGCKLSFCCNGAVKIKGLSWAWAVGSESPSAPIQLLTPEHWTPAFFILL